MVRLRHGIHVFLSLIDALSALMCLPGCLVVQATWQSVYSPCEKDPQNDAQYGALKAASAACAANQKAGECQRRLRN